MFGLVWPPFSPGLSSCCNLLVDRLWLTSSSTRLFAFHSLFADICCPVSYSDGLAAPYSLRRTLSSSPHLILFAYFESSRNLQSRRQGHQLYHLASPRVYTQHAWSEQNTSMACSFSTRRSCGKYLSPFPFTVPNMCASLHGHPISASNGSHGSTAMELH